MCGSGTLVPYAMARKTHVRSGHRPLGQSHLGGAVIYCSILAAALTGIFVFFLSQCPSLPVKNIPCAESELRYLKSQNIHCVEAELLNFKSQNILYAEVELRVTEYSACVISLVPYAMARNGHRPLGQSHLGGAVIFCSILAVAPTGIFVCFLRYMYFQAVTNQLTYDKDPDIRHTSWPKAAGTKLPTESTRQSEGEFSTL